MPSPIGHALGGALVGLALSRQPDRPVWRRAVDDLRRPLALAAIAAACAPDLDLLWGRHTMETHSLGAAGLAGLIAAALAPAGQRGRFGWVVALAWASHVLFDWMGSDDTPPLGVMAFWPLSTAFHFADVHVFPAISRRYWRAGFLAHNLWAVATEIALLGPPLLALILFRVRRGARMQHDEQVDTIRKESS
jgi:membrane-bound metal-dependent hydrolase YbcI (DUF457 family)